MSASASLIILALTIGPMERLQPVIEVDQRQWAVAWDDSGRTFAVAGTIDTIEGRRDFMEAIQRSQQVKPTPTPGPTFIPTPLSPMGNCFREARQACNDGMPPGSPNALCGAYWIAPSTCYFWCRDLTGNCPPPPPLATPPGATPHQAYQIQLLNRVTSTLDAERGL